MIAQVFLPFTNNGKDEHVTVINNQPMMRQEELRNQKGNQEENEQQKIQNQQEENALRDEWKIPEQEQPFSNKQNEQNQISDQVDDAKLKELLGNTICTLCDKGCNLLNPKCNRGTQEAQSVIQKYNETNGDEVAIQSELEEYNEQQNPGSKVLDYMMSMGLVITSTYYTSETLSRRKHNKGKHEQK